jgi:hypothetical protein
MLADIFILGLRPADHPISGATKIHFLGFYNRPYDLSRGRSA